MTFGLLRSAIGAKKHHSMVTDDELAVVQTGREQAKRCSGKTRGLDGMLETQSVAGTAQCLFAAYEG